MATSGAAEKLSSVDEAAKFLNLAPGMIQKLVELGNLLAESVDGRLVFAESELVRFDARRKHPHR